MGNQGALQRPQDPPRHPWGHALALGGANGRGAWNGPVVRWAFPAGRRAERGGGGLRGGLGGRVAWGRVASGRGRAQTLRHGTARTGAAPALMARRDVASAWKIFTVPLFERVKLQKVE
jgi:hypothetical protein